ncbi:MAG: DNA polymerase I [Epulopiscium sp. Nele67-Bin004]|nr:MAG: DNA polymerase I [Epulopiscium sp. Nele67-Bin004]
MDKILLIDGLSIVNRAYYGMPKLTTKTGFNTGAIVGFFNIIFSIINKDKPDLVCIAFDVSKPTFRHIHSETYKATRTGMQSELKEQIPVLKQILDTMGIFRIEKEGFEADDLIGTIAKKAEADGLSPIILSGDRDLLQIASKTTLIKVPTTKNRETITKEYFEADVIEEYGVTPTEFIDVKGLMGDSSDNVKGVPSIGQKTATKLITEYHSIENLYENIDKITAKKQRETLIAHKDDALESKFLVTIKCDVDIKFDWEQLKYNLVATDEVIELLNKFELSKILAKLAVVDKPAPAQLEIDTIDICALTFMDKSELSLVVDIQDINLHLYLTNKQKTVKTIVNLHNTDEVKVLKKLFEDPNTKKYVYDNKTLRHMLYNLQISLEGEVFDIIIASYLLAPTEKDYDVKTLLGQFLNVPDIAENDFGAISKSIFELVPKMHSELEQQDMLDLYYNVELPLSKVLFDMEIEGITINPDALKQFGEKLQLLIADIETQVYEEAGEKFNINSPKQLGVVLFEKMGIPPIKKTKTGYSTSAEVLEKLESLYPVVSKILEYRQYTKLHSTYVVGLLKEMSSDNKIHSTFKQTITATGRLSSTEPNLQNIPIRMELGREIRKVFIPKSEEYTFVDADYSQIELRVLAAMSGDETMINAFKNDIDIHSLTASQVFGVPLDEVTSTMRYKAKAVNFGIVYGIGAFSLSDDIKVSQKEAAQYIESYFENYPAIKSFLDKLVLDAEQTGYATTILNRRRPIVELSASNYSIREYGKRIAMNMPIQGSAADIIKIAMVNVANKLRGLKSNLILTVHDELLLEVHVSEQEIVTNILKEEMENAINFSVPLLVEVKSGNNWFETK